MQRKLLVLFCFFLSLGMAGGVAGSVGQPTLHSVVSIGPSSIASLEFTNQFGLFDRRWFSVGDSIGEWEVASIHSGDDISVHLVSSAGETLVLYPQSSTITSRGPETFDPDWINSESNPMLNNPIDLPEDVMANWANLSETEINGLIEMYRKHGWIASFEPRSAPHDPFRSTFTPIFPEKIRQRRAVIRESFYASLSDEQRAVDAMFRDALLPEGTTGSGVLPISALQRQTPEEREEMNQLRELRRKWLQALSDEQMRLYHRMTRDPNP